jgi:hypothetical protein
MRPLYIYTGEVVVKVISDWEVTITFKNIKRATNTNITLNR